MALKIKDVHMEVLRKYVLPFYTKENRARYVSLGLTERRYLFDGFWAANARHRVEIGQLMREVYEYMNDDHLHSALRALDKEAQNASGTA